MKNAIIYIFGLIIMLGACNTSQQKKDQENIDLVKKYVQAVENLDIEGMGALLDENYTGVGPSFSDSIGKADAVENWKYNVENLYDNIHYNRSKFVAVTIPEGENKGEWVANWAELMVTFKDGKTVTIWANSNYLIENKKIKRSLTFYNEADALRQLGFVMVPKEMLEQ